MTSTPVARSKARILRPSFPMIFPFISSLGREIVVASTSETTEFPRRWTAVVRISFARCSRRSFPAISSFRILPSMSFSYCFSIERFGLGVEVDLAFIQKFLLTNQTFLGSFQFTLSPLIFSQKFLTLFSCFLHGFLNYVLRLFFGVHPHLTYLEFHRAAFTQTYYPSEEIAKGNTEKPRKSE